jgi:hypothetical protein
LGEENPLTLSGLMVKYAHGNLASRHDNRWFLLGDVGMKINRTQALGLIKTFKGQYFGVTFVKKNGDVRQMNARLGVKKGVTGEGMKYDPAAKQLITAFDQQKKDFRMINLKTLSKLTIAGSTYEVQ